MMRCASAASCSWTATRSPHTWSLSEIGNAVRDMSLEIIDMIPCVSSSPLITLASISDGVRKMTTSSLTVAGFRRSWFLALVDDPAAGDRQDRPRLQDLAGWDREEVVRQQHQVRELAFGDAALPCFRELRVGGPERV